MCIGPSTPPAAFLLIDFPDTIYLDYLINSKDSDLSKYEEGGQSINLRLVIHRLGNGVLEDPRYREWMRLFGTETQVSILK
ncbi:hypothetical protein FRC03_007284 [Tulasnella sp. 419]|nr:hypothetical protein FRC03_007284 [Tulasnella sp. 419]